MLFLLLILFQVTTIKVLIPLIITKTREIKKNLINLWWNPSFWVFDSNT